MRKYEELESASHFSEKRIFLFAKNVAQIESTRELRLLDWQRV